MPVKVIVDDFTGRVLPIKFQGEATYRRATDTYTIKDGGKTIVHNPEETLPKDKPVVVALDLPLKPLTDVLTKLSEKKHHIVGGADDLTLSTFTQEFNEWNSFITKPSYKPDDAKAILDDTGYQNKYKGFFDKFKDYVTHLNAHKNKDSHENLKTAEYIYFIGDLHGSVHGLVKILEKAISLGHMNDDLVLLQNTCLVFMGDLTDRFVQHGALFILLGALINKNKHKIVVLYGNHETIDKSAVPCANGECTFHHEDSKLGNKLNIKDKFTFNEKKQIAPSELFLKFDYHGKTIYAAHGSLPKSLDKSTTDLTTDAPVSIDSDPYRDVVWGDVSENFMWMDGGRGTMIGQLYLDHAMQTHGINVMFRGHQDKYSNRILRKPIDPKKSYDSFVLKTTTPRQRFTYTYQSNGLFSVVGTPPLINPPLKAEFSPDDLFQGLVTSKFDITYEPEWVDFSAVKLAAGTEENFYTALMGAGYPFVSNITDKDPLPIGYKLIQDDDGARCASIFSLEDKRYYNVFTSSLVDERVDGYHTYASCFVLTTPDGARRMLDAFK